MHRRALAEHADECLVPMVQTATETVLVRYGAVPEVARCRSAAHEPLPWGTRVVVRTQRGLELGTLLQDAASRTNGASINGRSTDDEDSAPTIVRPADADDEARDAENRADCEREFNRWCERIREWKLELELIDLEWLLDRSKLVLYVLNDRGPECTKLALQAAASGLGTIEVQPVAADGLVSKPDPGGCGSGGCGCHS